MERRLRYIDGLKGLLAIVIFCYHYYIVLCNQDASLIPIPIVALFIRGYLAVELFFMISGFLMASAYTDKQINMTFYQYISKKLLRIMPCFFISNLLMVMISLIDSFFIKSSMMPAVTLWKSVISCMPFNYGWVEIDALYPNGGWFVSVLFLCYVIYFIILKIRNNHYAAYIPLCVGMVFIGWSAYKMNLQFPFLYRRTSRGYISFFVGVLLSHLFNQKFNKKLLSVLGLTVTGILLLLAHKFRFENVFGSVTYSFDFIIFPILLLSVTTLVSLQKILSKFWHLGRMSMSIYMMHLPVIRTIKLLYYHAGGVLRCRQLPLL